MSESKKIILFIVEGKTEKIALGTVLGRIFSSETTLFDIVQGDILTQVPKTGQNAISLVEKRITDFCGAIYQTSDIKAVFHICDMDGVFIDDAHIVAKNGSSITYTPTEIQAPDVYAISSRNKIKRENIKCLCKKDEILGISYSLYYMACNMEHVLHNKINPTKKQKIILADNFDMIYGEYPERFIQYMCTSDFSVMGDYADSWRRATTPTARDAVSSLGRYSNFGICFGTIQDKSKCEG